MPKVNSSNIDYVEYNPSENQLTVRFVHGGTYIYFDVTSEEYDALLAAPSVGSYFAKNIKNSKNWEKVDITT